MMATRAPFLQPRRLQIGAERRRQPLELGKGQRLAHAGECRPAGILLAGGGQQIADRCGGERPDLGRNVLRVVLQPRLVGNPDRRGFCWPPGRGRLCRRRLRGSRLLGRLLACAACADFAVLAAGLAVPASVRCLRHVCSSAAALDGLVHVLSSLLDGRPQMRSASIGHDQSRSQASRGGLASMPASSDRRATGQSPCAPTETPARLRWSCARVSGCDAGSGRSAR